MILGSRPLWGIYISIPIPALTFAEQIIVLVPYGVSTFLFFDHSVIQGFRINCSRPLWGIYISIQFTAKYINKFHEVLVPYGVSTFLFFIQVFIN